MKGMRDQTNKVNLRERHNNDELTWLSTDVTIDAYAFVTLLLIFSPQSNSAHSGEKSPRSTSRERPFSPSPFPFPLVRECFLCILHNSYVLSNEDLIFSSGYRVVSLLLALYCFSNNSSPFLPPSLSFSLPLLPFARPSFSAIAVFQRLAHPIIPNHFANNSLPAETLVQHLRARVICLGASRG